jgi:pimeloyl-ACP methyl ester carboxylesterase
VHYTYRDGPPEDEKPRLLMIHGYGATGSVFAKMIKELRKKFSVTSLDLLGMGFSGRPVFSLETAQDCINYFVLSIEAWMRETKYKEKGEYILLGHSLGGYLAINFCLQYPEKIKQLVLVSPVGVPSRPENKSL